MKKFIPLSSRVYAAMITLGPTDLCQRFGPEMTQVFAEDLDDSYRACGLAGAARVWLRAAKELIRIAVPEQISKREFAVPFIVFALFCVETGFQILALRHISPQPLAPEIAMALAFGLLAAAAAFVAIRAGNRSLPQPLDLGAASCSKSEI